MRVRHGLNGDSNEAQRNQRCQQSHTNINENGEGEQWGGIQYFLIIAHGPCVVFPRSQTSCPCELLHDANQGSAKELFFQDLTPGQKPR